MKKTNKIILFCGVLLVLIVVFFVVYFLVMENKSNENKILAIVGKNKISAEQVQDSIREKNKVKEINKEAINNNSQLSDKEKEKMLAQIDEQIVNEEQVLNAMVDHQIVLMDAEAKGLRVNREEAEAQVNQGDDIMREQLNSEDKNMREQAKIYYQLQEKSKKELGMTDDEYHEKLIDQMVDIMTLNLHYTNFVQNIYSGDDDQVMQQKAYDEYKKELRKKYEVNILN